MSFTCTATGGLPPLVARAQPKALSCSKAMASFGASGEATARGPLRAAGPHNQLPASWTPELQGSHGPFVLLSFPRCLRVRSFGSWLPDMTCHTLPYPAPRPRSIVPPPLIVVPPTVVLRLAVVHAVLPVVVLPVLPRG